LNLIENLATSFLLECVYARYFKASCCRQFYSSSQFPRFLWSVDDLLGFTFDRQNRERGTQKVTPPQMLGWASIGKHSVKASNAFKLLKFDACEP
jgi:hypothetical protein